MASLLSTHSEESKLIEVMHGNLPDKQIKLFYDMGRFFAGARNIPFNVYASANDEFILENVYSLHDTLRWATNHPPINVNNVDMLSVLHDFIEYIIDNVYDIHVDDHCFYKF
jgi:hypothetical protein